MAKGWFMAGSVLSQGRKYRYFSVNEEYLTRRPIPRNAFGLLEKLGRRGMWGFEGDLPPPLVNPGDIFWFRYKGEFLGEFEVVRLVGRDMTYRQTRRYPIVRVDYLNKGQGYKYLEEDEIERLRRDSIGMGPYVDTSEVEARTTRRIGQGKIRDRALARYRNTCALCEVDEPRLLIAGHIRPWSRGNSRDKGVPGNVILLCALHDSLFGNGFIRLDPSSLRVNYSGRLSDVLRRQIERVTQDHLSKPRDYPPLPKYLRWHCGHLFN